MDASAVSHKMLDMIAKMSKKPMTIIPDQISRKHECSVLRLRRTSHSKNAMSKEKLDSTRADVRMDTILTRFGPVVPVILANGTT